MIWAGAMATVATEFAQEMAELSPSEQRLHQIRIKALNGACGRLAAGTSSDDLPLGINLPDTMAPAASLAG